MRDYEPSKMKQIGFTGIRRVLEKANKMEAEGRSVVHFEIGQPDFVTPKYIRDAACESLMAGHTRYTSNYGTPALRKAIAEKLEKENGIHADPNSEIMVTAGGEEAMATAVLALVDAGDEVILTDPGYSPYDSMVKLANAVSVYVALDEANNWNFDFEKLESAISDKTKLLMLCNPINPTGTMMDKESLMKLRDICVKHDLLVVSDEAYERVLYDGNEHISIASLPDMWERTVTIQSFSKSHSMCGFRVGYIAANKTLMQIMIRSHQKIILCASTTSQDAALAALTVESDEVAHMMAEFDKRRKYIYSVLEELNIPCCKPQAAFYVFPNVSSLGIDGDEFCTRFLDEYGVACVPGSDFGPEAKNNLRISYATSMEQCVEGMERLKKFVGVLRAEMAG